MWRWLQQYFTFTRAERNGIMVLVVLCLLVLGGAKIYELLNPPKPLTQSSYKKEVDAFLAEYNSSDSVNAAQPEYNNAPGKDISPAVNKPSSFKTTVLDINKADSADFEALPGLGSTLSRRIVRFRQALGGFIAVEQLKEVYGLPDSTYRNLKSRFTVSTADVQLIHVNSVDAKQLSRHPYLDYKTAKAICTYRDKMKGIKDVNELKSLPGLSDSVFNKMAPYLSTQ